MSESRDCLQANMAETNPDAPGYVANQPTKFPWTGITLTPTTVAGYGITDGVILTGSYSDPVWITGLAWAKITGTPTLGTASTQNTSAFDASGAAATAQAFAIQRANQTGTQVASTISDFATAALMAVTWIALTGKPTFSAVATSGSYADLSNKPSIPSAQVNSDWSAVSGVTQILNKPSLSTVATSGAYSSLSGLPTLGTASAQATTAFATASQGALAASALQANQTITVSGDATGSGSTTIALTLSNVATAGTYSNVTVNAKGLATSGTTQTFSNAVSRSVSTTNNTANGFQPSATQATYVQYPVTITSTATIGGAGSGTIVLEICSTNSATGANWTTIDTFTNSQTITLAVALNSVQAMTTSVRGMVPVGWYCRIRSLAATGTVTYSTTSAGQETLL